jgi:hypothetical protein
MLNSDDPKIKLEKKEREKELTLDFVVDFKSFLITIFKFNKNDVAMEAINHMLLKNKSLINLEIFEVCLEFDEDISMYDSYFIKILKNIFILLANYWKKL